MDEMNEMIHEDTIETPMEEIVTEVGFGPEQPTVVTPIEQEPLQGPEIPTTSSLPETNTLGVDDSSTESYNQGQEGENEIGSCDCRSECRYNTGHTYKYANYGYSG